MALTMMVVKTMSKPLLGVERKINLIPGNKIMVAAAL
jgi:hypothetical protein